MYVCVCHSATSVTKAAVLPLVESHALNQSVSLCGCGHTLSHTHTHSLADSHAYTHSHTLLHTHTHTLSYRASDRSGLHLIQPNQDSSSGGARRRRATAGVTRPNGNEITEARRDSLNQQQKEQEFLSKAVTMETSQLSEMADVKDYKMDLGDTEEEKRQRSEEDERDCFNAFFSESLDTEKSNSPTVIEDKSNDVANDSASSEEAVKSTPLQDEITEMVNDINESTHLRESTSSPEPDAEHQTQNQPVQGEEDDNDKNPPALNGNGTEHQEVLESSESVQTPLNVSGEENQNLQDGLQVAQEDNNLPALGANWEEHQDLQDGLQIAKEDNSPALDDNGKEHQDLQEGLNIEQEDNDPSTHCDDNMEDHHDLQEGLNIEQEDNDPSTHCDDNMEDHHDLQEGLKIEQEDNDPSTHLNDNKEEHQDLLEGLKVEQEEKEASALDADREEHQDLQEGLKIEQEENYPFTAEATETDHKDQQESPKPEQESVLEQQIKELAVSDASTESCHDNDRDDLSDCLQVEMAIVSSDSDAEEQWKSMFSPVVDEEDTADAVGLDPIDASEEPHNQEDADATKEDSNTTLENNMELESEALTGTIDSVDILEQPECPTECELEDLSFDGSIHYRSLTKIPEDEEDSNQNPKHSLQRLSASTSELDKRLPQDYCVIEETKSENVSTEHVDFRVARQQWQKMAEQNKGQLHQTPIKQAICQGGHNYMYTPVRTLERPKKDQDSDSLSLGDFQYTQFSPCSEDSGLDDTSYRSPYDEPETPVEREIRETMEREESFRRERALSRSSSGEPIQSKPRPATLLTGRSEQEVRKIFNTPEDRCRSQRSPSSRTPTFSITASPSSRPSYHEMVANNVIILEPDSYPTSPRHRGKGLLSPGSNRFHEWPSEMTNVIILETSNLIIRSASEFCLSTTCQETQESTFHNNPFFKLRSHSTQSLVDQEIKVVRQRDEEFRRQRAQLYAKEKYDTVLVSPSLLESFNYDRPGDIPARCKSSPSSPSKIRKMDRSVLSCDQKVFLTCCNSYLIRV
uniref:Si:ch211-153l6.6 n=1 Tax=Astyanax mexicanus TaxID=7994 RepID=A0A3B1JYG8_ASTMX